ncbi:MAG: 4'-phosphopantetheinyl transferase superfamily protein [candidate division WOR-3 bacterium]
MIEGIGIDLIEIGRFAKVGTDFYQQVFTESEIKEIKNNHLLASLKFALKEAILKALGIGLSQGFFWKKVEIRGEDNKLDEVFKGKENKIGIHTGTGRSKKYAWAVAIIENKQEVY